MSWSAFQERNQGKLSRSLASPYLGCSSFWSGLTPWNLFAHNFGLICTTLAFGCNKAMVILLKHSKSISNQFGFATKGTQWKSAAGCGLGNIISNIISLMRKLNLPKGIDPKATLSTRVMSPLLFCYPSLVGVGEGFAISRGWDLCGSTLPAPRKNIFRPEGEH